MDSTQRVGSLTGSEPDAPQRISNFFNYLQLPAPRARLYRVVVVALALWVVGYIVLLVKVVPTGIYWLSYYAVNYHVGFVRRGLAGQLITLFPDRYYFPVAYTLMWGSFAVFCVALAVVARHVLVRGARAERRVIVALLIPVLPFAVTFAVFGPRPELFAAAALLLFAVGLSRLADVRAVIVASAVYGLAIAALAFFHEVIPIQFALGAVLAVSVLAVRMSSMARWSVILLATGPGLAATGIIVLFGRRDVAKQQLCDQVPHHLIQNPFQVPPDKIIDYALGRYSSVSDYHDWVCHNIVPYFGADVSAWLRSVTSLGILPLAAGFVHGMIVCIATVWLIQYFTGVRWKTFVEGIRGGLGLPMLALAMMIPVFATGLDWIRWWTIILTNIAGVYLVFAADQPEIERPVSNRTVKIFVVVLVLLACIPISAGPGYFTGWVTV